MVEVWRKPMKGILNMVGMTVGGWVGWWLGDFINITAALVLSGVFTVLGFFAVRWLEKEYLE
jgi:hypothetical protein